MGHRGAFFSLLNLSTAPCGVQSWMGHSHSEVGETEACGDYSPAPGGGAA